MNQTQRAYLIKKIEEKTKQEIKALESAKPEAPNLTNYLLHAVMNGNFQIVDNDKIKALITKKALKGKAGENWLNEKDRWSESGSSILLKTTDLFVLPDEYTKLNEAYEKSQMEISQKIRKLSLESESLITRIQLASDKTLQTLINEIDDMGNISLMDTRIKQIANS